MTTKQMLQTNAKTGADRRVVPRFIISPRDSITVRIFVGIHPHLAKPSNISLHGLGVLCDTLESPVGSIVRIEITVDNEIATRQSTVRHNHGNRFGFEFFAKDPDSTNQIQKMISILNLRRQVKDLKNAGDG